MTVMHQWENRQCRLCLGDRGTSVARGYELARARADSAAENETDGQNEGTGSVHHLELLLVTLPAAAAAAALQHPPQAGSSLL